MRLSSFGWRSRRDPQVRGIIGVAEDGVPFREIAEVIGRRLNAPVVSKVPEEAPGHFGWFAHFASLDAPASSRWTQEQLGGQPKQPGLISDLERGRYFEPRADLAQTAG
jgi:hypothetical protein